MQRGQGGGQGAVPASAFLAALPSFLPGLNFSNCSRRALEKALLGGMGSCLFERQPDLPSKATVFGNAIAEPGKPSACGFPEVSPSHSAPVPWLAGSLPASRAPLWL